MKDLFIGQNANIALACLFSQIYNAEKAGALAEKLLSTYGSLSRLLLIDPLTLEGDIGREAALYLSLSLNLSLRRETDKLSAGMTVTPAVLARHFCALYTNMGQECVYLVLMDEEERLLCVVRASVGAADGSGLLPRQVLELAMRAGAKAVYLTHNHPGGDLNPSEADMKITNAVNTSLEAARIRFLGHYIFARGEFMRVGDGKDEAAHSMDTKRIQSKIR